MHLQDTNLRPMVLQLFLKQLVVYNTMVVRLIGYWTYFDLTWARVLEDYREMVHLPTGNCKPKKNS